MLPLRYLIPSVKSDLKLKIASTNVVFSLLVVLFSLIKHSLAEENKNDIPFTINNSGAPNKLNKIPLIPCPISFPEFVAT